MAVMLKMKENVKTRAKFSDMGIKELMIELAGQATAAAGGFLISRAAVFGQFLPFGLAYAAALPQDYLAMGALGCFIGYFLPVTGAGAFRYLAALFAIVAIKALLAAMTGYAKSPAWSAAVAFVVTLATGLVTTPTDVGGMFFALEEAVLCLGGTYFMSRSFKITRMQTAGLRGQELACLLISIDILLLGTMSFAPGGISVGKILCVAFVLLASRYGQIQAGAISGIVTGLAAAMSGSSLSVAVILAFSGLMAGIFAVHGKYIQVVVFLLSAAVSSAMNGNLTETVEFMIEAAFGSALFLCIPKSLAVRAGQAFSPPAKTVSENSMKKSVMMRLNFAAGALSDVSQTVENVANELSRINAPDFEGVLSGVEGEACGGCSLCVHCWEQKKNDTVSAVLDMVRAIKEGRVDPQEEASDEFRGRCLRPARVGAAVVKFYTDYASRIAAESRLADVRSVVSDQFDGISSMLSDLAAELDRDEAFDDRMAGKIAAALKNIDIRADECGCRIDKYGRMTVEIVVKTVDSTKYNRMKILRQVEVCCDRDFEPPVLTENGGEIYITLTEKAVITVDIGVSQIACSPSGISGDAYSHFSDGKGRLFMILSDGMGAGGRAAVDGAMASGLMTRLLQSGFGYDCSLRIVNSAMLFKSTDESLATVDVSCIDLFSGRIDLLKAGAAPTVVRRNGRCGRAQSTSLPAGILREVGFDKATVKLRPGDAVIMMSDGAVSEGTDWICAEAEAWQDGSAQDLAEHLARCAKRRRTDNHEDDITVMTAIIERAV